ncbi:MAG: hypothetical protein IIB07_02635 [Bacteroidetes bacterium]|nr:hypothetical protein [Bacteroidota bacterium]
MTHDDLLFGANGTPSTQTYGDSAVIGTALNAARSDHKHAFPASLVATGTYTGDGATSQAITGIGFQVKYLLITEVITVDGIRVEIQSDHDSITWGSGTAAQKEVWSKWFVASKTNRDTVHTEAQQNTLYRDLVILSTDNLEQARRMKYRVLSKINQKHVYILFDPPFYNVQIGDFTVHSLAEDLNLKLEQLGYSNVRIVREKINNYR